MKKKIQGIINSTQKDLLELKPDKIKFEITPDKTLFYTFKKSDYTFFISYFLNFEDLEDESSVVCFKGYTKLPSYAGDFKSSLQEIRKYI